jgi:SAM-dependent methyltransferase
MRYHDSTMSRAIDSVEWKKRAHELFAFSSNEYAFERERDPSFLRQLTIVLKMLANERGRVLDIGCAAGSEVTALRERGFEVVGIDFSTDMLQHARRRFRVDPKVHFSRADAEFLPFRSASFDHVTCLGVFEYLPDYRRAVAEIHRVLRPGGLAILSIPSRISPYYVTHDVAHASLGPIWRSLKRWAGIQPVPESGQVPRHRRRLCVPWTLRSMLRERGLIPEQSAFSRFLLFPLDRVWPGASARVEGWLERYSSSRTVGWIGCQYLLASRKAI